MSQDPGSPPQIGLVTEPLAGRPLAEVMDWLVREVPEIRGLEIGDRLHHLGRIGIENPSHRDKPRQQAHRQRQRRAEQQPR